jgi:DNA-binding PadR family transcriptional regulator
MADGNAMRVGLMRLGSRVEKKLRERVLKSFLDVLILSKLENSEPMSGYDFISFINEEFGIIISTGTIYSNLYALERDGFLKGYHSQGKRVYKMSNKGMQFINETCQAIDPVKNWIEKIMKHRS